MRKALLILSILVFTVGTVLADKPADSAGVIRIKSTVERQDPSFEIRATSGNRNVTGSQTGTVLEVNDISQGDVEVAFSIYQTEDAKNRFGYSFEVSFSEFKGTINNEVYTVNTGMEISDPTGAWYTADEAEGIVSVVVPKKEDNTIVGSVTFNGNKPVHKSDVAKTSFNVTWKEDPEAPHGDYEADVTMTITVS